jgi:flagella synthesis protein FlgN
MLRDLQTCLDTEIALVQEFLVVLDQETAVLTEGRGEAALAETTARKNHYADQLAAVGEQRQKLLTALGYSADKTGLDALSHDHPELRSRCAQLLEKARQASELNTSNGIIIDTFLQHNQQALDTLRSLAGIGALYDASGRTRPAGAATSKNIKAG